MDTLRRDLIYATRVLLKRPGFTLVAVMTLAVGIGANATIFSLIDGVLLRPLPYPHADRLVNIWTIYGFSNGQRDISSPPNYLDVASRTKTLEAVGGFTEASFTMAGNGEPESFPGVRMTASMGRVLGLAPQLGRWFTPEEDDGGHTVVLLSDSLWRSRFGGDRAVLGRSLVLNGTPYEVIGVLPRGIGFPSLLTHLYAPISFTQEARASRGDVFLSVVARMRPGVRLATVEAELQTLSAWLAGAWPRVDRGMQMHAEPLQNTLAGDVRKMLLVLWAAVAFMLAVACANVANLLLTHASGRQREFALRRALGATGVHLLQQLLTESLVLGALGGAAGLVLAAWAAPAMVSRLPAGFPHIREFGLDARVLWFTGAVSALTAILFGLAPALASAHRDLGTAIGEGGERGGRKTGHRRLGRALVTGEVAVVLVLLVGAGLVLRSLVRLSAVSPGFRAPGLIAWQMIPPAKRYPNAASRRVLYHSVLEQVKSLPGVESAAVAMPLPFGPVDLVLDSGFAVAGRPIPPPDQMPQAFIARISPGYFSTVGIPLLRGRAFDSRETESSAPVAIVSETLARRYFAREDAVGQRLLLGGQKLEAQIVGVVGDVKHNDLRSETRPEIYLPMARFPTPSAGLVVRAKSDAAALLPAVERRVWSVESGLAANLAAPVERLLYASLAPARIAAELLAIFAATTLLLGLVGIYGVLSYAVSQRTREIGIRLALGAPPRLVLRGVLGEALRMAVAGVVIGLVAAVALARFLADVLFGVPALDPATYAAVSVCLPCAALAAAWFPARRATRVDPAASLRSE